MLLDVRSEVAEMVNLVRNETVRGKAADRKPTPALSSLPPRSTSKLLELPVNTLATLNGKQVSSLLHVRKIRSQRTGNNRFRISSSSMDVLLHNPPTSLVELPVELIELIVIEIVTPRDLLHLACTSKVLASVIIPAHLDYAFIHCQATGRLTDQVWTHLASVPVRCSRIRTLNVVQFEPETTRVPNVDEADAHTVSVPPASVVDVLRNARKLRAFSWYTSKLAYTANGDPDGRPPGDMFATLLASCTRITDLRVVLKAPRWPPEAMAPSDILELYRELTPVSRRLPPLELHCQ